MRMKTLALLAALTASLVTMPAMAEGMKHGEGEHKNHGSEHAEKMDMKMVETEATVNKISDDSLNVSHPAIPEIKWPAMTMDLPLVEGAEVDGIAEGDKVIIVLVQKDDGNYAIKSAKTLEEIKAN